MTLSIGTRLGPYEITAQIGVGGMGEVYRARDERLDREVAIKVLPEVVADDPERLARFEREAKAVARLSHPSILEIHELDEHEGRPYMVTELLEGETLRERLEGVPLGWRRATEIRDGGASGVREVLGALRLAQSERADTLPNFGNTAALRGPESGLPAFRVLLTA